MKQNYKKAIAILGTICTLTLNTAFPALAAENETDMFRLYNPNSGEHFYTDSSTEKDALVRSGWKYEGIGWVAPVNSSTPVFRLYNANAGDHHYTTDVKEKNSLVSLGWKDEGIGWYSDDAKTVPLYRQYNPNSKTGSHHYTTSSDERSGLVSIGWKDEGIGWYALKAGTPSVNQTDPEKEAVIDLLCIYPGSVDGVPTGWWGASGASFPSMPAFVRSMEFFKNGQVEIQICLGGNPPFSTISIGSYRFEILDVYSNLEDLAEFKMVIYGVSYGSNSGDAVFEISINKGRNLHCSTTQATYSGMTFNPVGKPIIPTVDSSGRVTLLH